MSASCLDVSAESADGAATCAEDNRESGCEHVKGDAFDGWFHELGAQGFLPD